MLGEVVPKGSNREYTVVASNTKHIYSSPSKFKVLFQE